MKDLIFISDFDGTITNKDFYWILLDDFIGQKGIDYYTEWKKTKKIGIEFLNKVFTWHNFTEEERVQALDQVCIDKDLDKVIEFVEKNGGDFRILSAGFRYYIDYVLAKYDLSDIPVLTNEGAFREGRFIMEADESSPFYSELYGIDKEKVMCHYKTLYKKVCFAGDSEPDFGAAKHADVIFAKNELAHLLDQAGIKYYCYNNFADILKVLMIL